MATITPTLPSSARYSGVQGDVRLCVQDLAIAGTYAAVTGAATTGITVTPQMFGMTRIGTIDIMDKWTADAATKKVRWYGPVTGSANGNHLLALVDKDDDLQAADGAVTGVTCTVRVHGK